MPTAYLLPNGRTQFFNPLTGTFLAFGSVYTYAAGTSTPQNTWADGNQVTVNANPITLDAYGSASIFWNGDYKVSVFDSLSNLVYTQDNMTTTAVTGGQLPATTTNDNASAGNVGEYVTGINSGSITTVTAFNAASISLTAGDWDVDGTVLIDPGGVISQFTVGINQTSATVPGTVGTYNQLTASLTTGTNQAISTPVVRQSLSATTTVYLVGYAAFTSTATHSSFMRARRVR